MAKEKFADLAEAHAKLCRELQEQREALTHTLRTMYGRVISDADLEQHRLAVVALEEVKRRLSTVSLKMAAHR